MPVSAQWKTIESNLKQAEVEQVAKLGFTHVRFVLGRGFLQDMEPPYRLFPEGLRLLDWAIRLAVDNGLGVVLDMHQTPAPDIFHDPKALAAYRTLWQGLATHYAKHFPTVIFELITEPAVRELTRGEPADADVEHWRTILKTLVRVIDDADPGRYIVVDGGGWGNTEDLLRLGNLGLPHLIYAFSYFLPFMFTHQGAAWVDRSISALHGIHYPLPKSEVEKAWDAAREADFQEWPFLQNPDGFDKEAMRESLKPLFDFAQRERIEIYCGAFGVYKPIAPPDDRARWIGDLVDVLTEQHVGWAMWAYHASFDLVDKSGQPDPAVIKALGLKEYAPSAQSERPK